MKLSLLGNKCLFPHECVNEVNEYNEKPTIKYGEVYVYGVWGSIVVNGIGNLYFG